ncbi:DNA-binding transcriptional MerR regulator [Streptacidiphilus sp. MAP12-16]|uniref:DNA polymerase III subunit beta family protein n=1 Tax=Streptacidiphilus sp. MAP12-16 TaxID=3156300 RepID=UPI00351753AF
MHSIGEMARDSGLTVSALRFYDGAGVLVPVWVDPTSGYRWYSQEQRGEARLLSLLRRVGMPLADIRLVLAGWSSDDTTLVRKLLDAHLLRLENGLDNARRELSTVRELLALRENPMNDTRPTALRLSLAASELAAALDAVRFAVSSDPELPMLAGVLFDIDAEEAAGNALRLVATDRYRLAVSRATVRPGGSLVSKRVIVPTALADAMRAPLNGDGTSGDGTSGNGTTIGDHPVTLTVDSDRITLEVDGSQAAGAYLVHDFPDYRRLTRLPAGRRFPVDVAALSKELRRRDSESADVSVLVVTPDGALAVASRDGEHDRTDHVGVNREFLLDALSAAARDRLVLELGSPIAPLAVRLPDREDTFSLLMPVRLDH